MINAKFIFFAVAMLMLLVPTSASSQEIKGRYSPDSSPDYFMFGRHSEGEIYGMDRLIRYTTMQDMVDNYSNPSEWVNKVVVNSPEIIIAFEGTRFSLNGEGYSSTPRCISVYYIDEDSQFRLLRVYFGKGRYERSLGGYKIRVSAKESSIYKGKTLVYRMIPPTNA